MYRQVYNVSKTNIFQVQISRTRRYFFSLYLNVVLMVLRDGGMGGWGELIPKEVGAKRITRGCDIHGGEGYIIDGGQMEVTLHIYIYVHIYVWNLIIFNLIMY